MEVMLSTVTPMRLISVNIMKAPCHCLPLLASADGGIVGDGVPGDAKAPHLRKNNEGALPLLPLLASADRGIVCEGVHGDAKAPHLRKT